MKDAAKIYKKSYEDAYKASHPICSTLHEHSLPYHEIPVIRGQLTHLDNLIVFFTQNLETQKMEADKKLDVFKLQLTKLQTALELLTEGKRNFKDYEKEHEKHVHEFRANVFVSAG